MRRIVVLLASLLAFTSGPALWGAQSAVLNGTNLGTFLIPNTAPYSGLTSSYIAGRLDNLVIPASGTSEIANVGGLSVFVNGLSGGSCGVPSIGIADNVDHFSVDNFYVCASIPSGATDIFFKVQRDVPNSQMLVEVWSFDATKYNQAVAPIDVIGTATLPYGATIGNTNNNFHLAFLKWGSGTQPINTQMASSRPVQQQDNANLANWTFEASGADSSGNGLNINFSSPSYATTPIHNPGCVLQQVSFSTIFTAQADGTICYPLDGGTTLSYLWSYLGVGADGVTQTPLFSSATAAQPTLTGLIRGSLNLQLIVTDGSGHSTTAIVHDGVVVTDANHIVNSMGNANIDKLYMPMIQWGFNPWPYFDDRQKFYADLFGGLLNSTFSNVWDAAQPGTISCSNGSTTCTVSGANVQTIFCAGGTASDGSVVVVWYNSLNNRGEYGIAGCPTATTITLARSYRDATVTGTNYSQMTPADLSNWINQSNNANYYDNVAGQCGLYYRSGFDTAYSNCHQLGKYWWKMPFIDQGRTCDLGGVYPCLAPRIRAMLGLVTLALDGTLPNFWPAMELNWEPVDEFRITSGLSVPLDDLRERSASTAMVAYAGLFEPDATHKATALAALSSSIQNFWSLQQQPDGSFVNSSFGTASWNGAAGTVTVTNGSASVVGSGTVWSSGTFPSGYTFYTQAPSGPHCTSADQGDTVAYIPTFVDATHITISPAYQGPTASGRWWQVNNLDGCGAQPFMMGYNARAMDLTRQALSASDPVNSARAKTILLNDVNWLVSTGFIGSSAAPAPALTVNGLFYGRIFAGCEPNPFANTQCSGLPQTSSVDTFTKVQSIQNSRYLAAETMAAFAYAFELGGLGSVKTTADLLYGAVYGGQGGPNSDANFVYFELGKPGTVGTAQAGTKSKDFGFSFGWGNGAVWPAARLGALSVAPAGGTITSGVALAGVVH